MAGERCGHPVLCSSDWLYDRLDDDQDVPLFELRDLSDTVPIIPRLIHTAVREIINADYPIVHSLVRVPTALPNSSKAQGTVKCEEFCSSGFYGESMVSRTGDLVGWDISLSQLQDGIHFLARESKLETSPCSWRVPHERLSGEYRESRESLTVREPEEVSERRFSRAVDSVRQAIRKGVRFVMVGGPSSGGKTTFARRLCQSLAQGGEFAPVLLSVDNYYRPPEELPLDEFGRPDTECLEALDLDLLRADLSGLRCGDDVAVPIFDFETKRRLPQRTPLKLERDNGVLIVEGIHVLNPRLSRSPLVLVDDQTFRIFVVPLPQLNVDDGHVIGHSLTRLLRGILRDSRERSYSVEDTLERWEAVRRGEARHVFPFVDEADLVFNSSPPNELYLLSSLCAPLLSRVPPDSPHFSTCAQILRTISRVPQFAFPLATPQISLGPPTADCPSK